MKKGLKSITFIFIIILFSSLLFTGCNREIEIIDITEFDSYFETEYFRCYYYQDRLGSLFGNRYLAIGGFTEKGLQQSELIIPISINGERVSIFGYKTTKREGTYEFVNYFEGNEDNLKKIFSFDHPTFYGEYLKDHNFITVIITHPGYLPSFAHTGHLPFKEKDNFLGKIYDSYGLFKLSNIAYLANYDFYNDFTSFFKFGYRINEVLLWNDHLSVGEKIMTPPPLERLTRNGYSFGGWYTEPECINEWDFNMPPFSSDEDLDKRFRLYAKWIENE